MREAPTERVGGCDSGPGANRTTMGDSHLGSRAGGRECGRLLGGVCASSSCPFSSNRSHQTCFGQPDAVTVKVRRCRRDACTVAQPKKCVEVALKEETRILDVEVPSLPTRQQQQQQWWCWPSTCCTSRSASETAVVPCESVTTTAPTEENTTLTV